MTHVQVCLCVCVCCICGPTVDRYKGLPRQSTCLLCLWQKYMSSECIASGRKRIKQASNDICRSSRSGIGCLREAFSQLTLGPETHLKKKKSKRRLSLPLPTAATISRSSSDNNEDLHRLEDDPKKSKKVNFARDDYDLIKSKKKSISEQNIDHDHDHDGYFNDESEEESHTHGSISSSNSVYSVVVFHDNDDCGHSTSEHNENVATVTNEHYSEVCQEKGRKRSRM